MPIPITIDGKGYDLDGLTDEAKSLLAHIQITDQEISRLQQRLAIAQTARQSYARALQEQLPES